MRRDIPLRFRRLAALWAGGGVALALVTWACFQLGLNLAATGFIFLIAIVLLSLFDSPVSSVIFSLVAVACLAYFFVPPVFSFAVAAVEDIVALAAFVVSSLAVTVLVRRLRGSSAVYRERTALLDLTHDPVFVLDTEDLITYWNRGAEELYGWNKDEALGKSPRELLRTVFPAPFDDIRQILHRTGRWEGELVHTTRDGRQVMVASRWSLQRDGEGRLLGMLQTNNDITDRRRAEQALRRNQETYLAEAQELSRTGSFGWNPASGEIFWSKESFRIFAYDPGVTPTLELVLQRVHPDDVARVRETVERARNDRQNFDLEHRLIMPDGSVKHLRVVAHSVIDEQGQAVFMGALMDITSERLAQEELRSSEQRYRHLFEHMPVALLQLDPRGLAELFKSLREQGVSDLGPYLDRNPDMLNRMMDLIIVADANDYAVRLFGARDRSELIGPSQSFWKKSPHSFRRSMESRFRGEGSFQQEIELGTLDGREIHALFSAARLAGGTGLSLVGLIDITERVRAQQRLAQVQAEFAHAARLAMLGELAASIAHEINQPLTALRINAETVVRWLNRPEPNLAQVRDKMVRMNADAARAADIIARIRAMAAGRGPERAPLALGELITESLLFLRHELQSRGVSVSLDLAPGLPPVIGDRTQLQQVVVNLAINAAQAMDESGIARPRLSITTLAADGPSVSCVVEDNGPGIKPDHLSRLFDSFFTTKDAGMGMGLPISRSIIEAHRGELRADNGSALGGARFTFLLPADGTSAS